MVSDSLTNADDFDEVLAWLNADREVAADLYVQLRHDLVKIFLWNRCADPEGLSDEVFDRVTKKVRKLRQTYEGDPRLFFYGVARNLVKESAKKIKTYASFDDVDATMRARAHVENDEEEAAYAREQCLQSCLQDLSSEQRRLILDYYAMEKQGKVPHRLKIAEELGLSVQTLRVRVYRIRIALERCIERCVDRQGFKR